MEFLSGQRRASFPRTKNSNPKLKPQTFLVCVLWVFGFLVSSCWCLNLFVVLGNSARSIGSHKRGPLKNGPSLGQRGSEPRTYPVQPGLGMSGVPNPPMGMGPNKKEKMGHPLARGVRNPGHTQSGLDWVRRGFPRTGSPGRKKSRRRG